MKEVKCIFPFYDRKDKCDREIGDRWEVSDDRATALVESAFGKLVDIVGDAPSEKKTTTRRRTSKAKAAEEK